MGTSLHQNMGTSHTQSSQKSTSPTNDKVTSNQDQTDISSVPLQENQGQGVYNIATENQNGNNNYATTHAQQQPVFQPYGQLGASVLPSNYPTVQPGFISGSFALVNGSQMAANQQLPYTNPGYFMPTTFTFPTPSLAGPAPPLQPFVQPSSQVTPATSTEEWKKQKLTHLQKNPLLANVQTGLEKECDSDAFGFANTYNSQNNQSPANPQKPQMSVTVRASLLRVRLAKLTETLPMQGASLQQVYKQKAAQIEKARYTELLARQSTPWLIPTVNSTYDSQHHDVITSIERNLEFLERSSGCKSKKDSDKQGDAEEEQHYGEMTGDTATYIKYTHQPGYKPNIPGVLLPDQMLSTASKKLLQAWYEKNKHQPYPKSLLGLAREVRTSVHNVRQWLKQQQARKESEETGEQGGKLVSESQGERDRKKQRTE